MTWVNGRGAFLSSVVHWLTKGCSVESSRGDETLARGKVVSLKANRAGGFEKVERGKPPAVWAVFNTPQCCFVLI